jgi:hypothetical protein
MQKLKDTNKVTVFQLRMLVSTFQLKSEIQSVDLYFITIMNKRYSLAIFIFKENTLDFYENYKYLVYHFNNLI